MKILLFFCLHILVQFTQAQVHQHSETALLKDTLKGSPSRESHALIGDNHILIQYHSPGVKGRVIWGGLVAYGQVWVTGAHNATSIEFSEDIKIDNTLLKAGKYAFFTIPQKDKWTLILNKNWKQHLTDAYDAKEDILRFSVKPKKLKQHTERLQYFIIQKSEKEAIIKMLWEKIELSFSLFNQN